MRSKKAKVYLRPGLDLIVHKRSCTDHHSEYQIHKDFKNCQIYEYWAWSEAKRDWVWPSEYHNILR